MVWQTRCLPTTLILGLFSHTLSSLLHHLPFQDRLSVPSIHPYISEFFTRFTGLLLCLPTSLSCFDPGLFSLSACTIVRWQNLSLKLPRSVLLLFFSWFSFFELTIQDCPFLVSWFEVTSHFHWLICFCHRLCFYHNGSSFFSSICSFSHPYFDLFLGERSYF